MSFVVLPPEINSLRMFIGAGTAPMLAAAAAWDGLAEELGPRRNHLRRSRPGWRVRRGRVRQPWRWRQRRPHAGG